MCISHKAPFTRLEHFTGHAKELMDTQELGLLINILKNAELYREYDDFGKEVLHREEIKNFYKDPDGKYAAALINLGNAY